MSGIIQNPPDADMWRDAGLAKWQKKGKPFAREDWDQVLGHTQVRRSPLDIIPPVVASTLNHLDNKRTEYGEE